MDKGQKALFLLFCWNVTLKSCTANIHGVSLIHARVQTRAEYGTRKHQLTLVRKKSISVILQVQETLWGWYVQCEEDLWYLPWDYFCVCVHSLERFMLFFCLSGQKVLPVALGKLEAIGHATYRYSALIVPFFGFDCPLFLFSRETPFLFKSHDMISFSCITSKCSSPTLPFKTVLNLCPWLHTGAITNKNQFLFYT